MAVLSPGVNNQHGSDEEKASGHGFIRCFCWSIACRFQLTRQILDVTGAATLPSTGRPSSGGPCPKRKAFEIALECLVNEFVRRLVSVQHETANRVQCLPVENQ